MGPGDHPVSQRLDVPLSRKPLAAAGLSAVAALGLSVGSSAAVASATPSGHEAIAAAAASLSVPQAVKPASAQPASTPPVAAAPGTYTVVPGDSLWAIGQRFGVDMDALAATNHMQLTDVLVVGRSLTLPAAGATSPAPVSTTTSRTSSGTPASSTDHQAASGSSSSLERCVISRESGGNAQATNGSGHWGLFQFSSSAWASYGGSASQFGHASAAEQEQVFNNAIARGGASNWTPYDGC